MSSLMIHEFDLHEARPMTELGYEEGGEGFDTEDEIASTIEDSYRRMDMRAAKRVRRKELRQWWR